MLACFLWYVTACRAWTRRSYSGRWYIIWIWLISLLNEVNDHNLSDPVYLFICHHGFNAKVRCWALLHSREPLKVIALCEAAVELNLNVWLIYVISETVPALGQKLLDHCFLAGADRVFDYKSFSSLDVEVWLGEYHLVDQLGGDQLVLLQLFENPLEYFLFINLRHYLQRTHPS